MNEQNALRTLTDQDFQSEVLQSKMPALVEFGADWCGPCHIVAPILKELASEFKGSVKVFTMDVDANKQVASEHGIQGIPTFLFIKDGRVLDHVVGVVSKELLRTKVNALLQTKQEESK